MNKERIKSFILILLILNSIQLTLQLWFDSKLWPSGYDFVEVFKSIPGVGKIVSYFSEEEVEYLGEEFYAMTVKPRRIVVNGGGAREIYLKESELYNEGMGYVDDVMKSINDSEIEMVKISYDEWKNYFKAKSVYVDFGYTTDAESLNEMYSLDNAAGRFRDCSDFSGFIIMPDNVTGKATVCMLDETDNSVYSYSFRTKTEPLLEFISATTYQKQQNDAFAFEINLDVMTSSEDEIQRNVAFSPLSLLSIPTEFEKDPVLESEKVFNSADELEHFAEKALNLFGYTASSLRKTVKNDGTISFVENKATITFFYDGTIEYSAVDSESGLSLSNSGVSCYQAICDVLNISGKLWSASDIEFKNPDYQLSSELADNKENVYTVKIDSLYNGTVINFENVAENAVFAQVEGGNITKLVMHLYDLSETKQIHETAPVLMGIDAVYEKYNDVGMVINDVYRCYEFDDSGKGIVKWKFELDSENQSMVVDADYLD